MSKLIDISNVKKLPKKKVQQITFKRNCNPETFIEESHFDRNEGYNVTLRNINSKSPITLKEDVFAGHYTVNTEKQTLTLDYAEALDLYILLKSVYTKDDGIEAIEDLLD
jgi:uncharacterized membrane protein YfhO